MYRTEKRNGLVLIRPGETTAFAKDNGRLAEIRDPRALQAHLQAAFDKSIAPKLTKLKEALRGNGIDTVLGVMSLKVELPAVATTGLATAGLVAAGAAINPVAAGVAGVALLLAKVLRDRRKARESLLVYVARVAPLPS